MIKYILRFFIKEKKVIHPLQQPRSTKLRVGSFVECHKGQHRGRKGSITKITTEHHDPPLVSVKDRRNKIFHTCLSTLR